VKLDALQRCILDTERHVGHMTYMKGEKIVSSREFQQQFARISKELQPGEAIAVTKHGEKIGTFIRAGKGPQKVPDFYANLKVLGRSPSTGQKMIDQIAHDLS
jgi:hypothetical protein